MLKQKTALNSQQASKNMAAIKKIWPSLWRDSHFSLQTVNSALLVSIVGTNRRAAAAADASVGIDVINLALGDSLHGANGLACAACDTSVCNYVSHDFSCFRFRFSYYATKLRLIIDSSNLFGQIISTFF